MHEYSTNKTIVVARDDLERLLEVWSIINNTKANCCKERFHNFSSSLESEDPDQSVEWRKTANTQLSIF